MIFQGQRILHHERFMCIIILTWDTMFNSIHTSFQGPLIALPIDMSVHIGWTFGHVAQCQHAKQCVPGKKGNGLGDDI